MHAPGATPHSSAGSSQACGVIRVTRSRDIDPQVRHASCRKRWCAKRSHHPNRPCCSPSARSLRPSRAQAACTTRVTRASSVASVPPDYLALYQKWGAAYGVPWQLLAAVGSVESRHGRDPGAYVPHTRGVLGPMQFQAGSNKAAQARGLRRAIRASAAPGASTASPPDIRRTAWTTPTTRSRRRRPRSPTTPAAPHLWPRALWRYNALHSYRKTVLRRAAHFGMSSACGLLRQSEQASLTLDGRPARPARDRRRRRLDARHGARGDAPEPARDRRDRLRAGRRRRHRARRRRPAPRRAAGLDRAAPPHRRHDHPHRPRRATSAAPHKVSNHWYGRAATISEVDGEAVGPRLARRGRALGRAADGAQGAPAGRDRRALGEPGEPALVHRPRRAGRDPRRLRRRRREEAR